MSLFDSQRIYHPHLHFQVFPQKCSWIINSFIVHIYTKMDYCIIIGTVENHFPLYNFSSKSKINRIYTSSHLFSKLHLPMESNKLSTQPFINRILVSDKLSITHIISKSSKKTLSPMNHKKYFILLL